ncbi:MAG: hypothetical protein K0S56_3259 [Microvirga sp.]|jgi:hypothetical protein|nr:hypothetical protein [Microvirga sp.]
MLQLWKARQGRKAAVATIAPLIARSDGCIGEIPAGAWHDAYLVGFLSMLASLEAWKKVGPVSSQALGLIQAETLAELSGEVAVVLGEEIYTLSMDENMEFGEGCQQAVIVHAALERAGADDMLLTQQDWPFEEHRDSDLRNLWKETFEARIAALR